MQWLGENQVPFCIIFTKADKLSKTKLPEQINNYINEMLKYWEQMPTYFITSSSSGLGKEDLLNYIDQINQEINQS